MIKHRHAFGGLAYMYAFIEYLDMFIEEGGKSVIIHEGDTYDRARFMAGAIGPDEFTEYGAASYAAAKIIYGTEPDLTFGGQVDIAFLADIDPARAKHDFRDILIHQSDVEYYGEREFGVSFRKDMHAIRHPNLFGREWEAECISDWLGGESSPEYRDSLSSVAGFLSVNAGREWNDVLPTQRDKTIVVYEPILTAFIDEVRRSCSYSPDLPAGLVRYLFGAEDYHQVTILDKKRLTKVMAYNINGMLGTSYEDPLPELILPTRLIEARFKEKSTGEISPAAVTLVFDEGWTIDMRLYMSTRTISEVSLKFTIDMVGKPYGIVQNQCAWDDADSFIPRMS